MWKLPSLLQAACAIICVATTATNEDFDQCPKPTLQTPVPLSHMYGHPEECSSYFMCIQNHPVPRYCANGTAWTNFFQTCVVINSELDTCTRENAKRECEKGTVDGLIPHPSVCQRYYNCSNLEGPGLHSPFEQFEEECPYPQLFDIAEKRCKDFKNTHCGPFRIASKDPCDYYNKQCTGILCESCNTRFPSCVNLTDGMHEHPLKVWSPWYIRCDGERTVEVATCTDDPTISSARIFSPEKHECVTLWEIPGDRGGLEPSCDGKPDGSYETMERPDVYYTCPGPQVSYCNGGAVFNETTQACDSSAYDSQDTVLQ